jgi:hypothetical protein
MTTTKERIHQNIFFEYGLGKTTLDINRLAATVSSSRRALKTSLLSILIAASTGCSNGFTSGDTGSSTAIPTLDSCGGCDIAGKGGSLYLMKTGNVIGTMAIALPTDKWSSGCINGAGSSRINYLILSTTSEAYIIGRIYSTTGCNDADLDMMKTQRYWFSSLGSASTSFEANTLRTQLAQVWEEPHSTSTLNDINTRCSGVAGTTTIGVARDTSICLSDSGNGQPFPILVDDTSTLFWTNGNTLRLGSSAGLAAAGTDGHFTR